MKKPKNYGYLLYLVVGVSILACIIGYALSTREEIQYESSQTSSSWDGTWKYGDSWTIKLNSKTDEAIVNGKSCFWQDGGNYAVIGVDRTSVLYLRKDGHLYTGDNKGNISVDFGFSLTKQ